MNTLTNTYAHLKQTRSREYIIALDGLEFAFSKVQLEQIKELHNAGYHFKDISKIVKRNPYEVIIALLHLAREGAWLRPIF